MIQQTAMGEWVLTPGSDLTSGQMREGIAALDASLAGGPQKQINAAILELLGATDRPPQLSDEEAVARTQALKMMSWEYPVDVVINACRKWRTVPSKGRWWPTEQDLRAQAEPLFAPRRTLRERASMLLRELEASEQQAREDDERRRTSPLAGSYQRKFREMMRQRMRPDRFDAYFHHAYLMFQGEDTIVVSNAAAHYVFTTEGADLLRELGLRVIHDPKPFVKVRRPMWEDESAQDRETVTRKFNRLRDATAKGEDLARLRAAGDI